MKLTKKQIIILAGALVLLLIVILLVVFLKPKKEVITPIDEQQKQTDSEQLPMSEEDKNFNSIEFESKSEQDTDSQIISTAKNFIERYGSWSNQSQDFYELITPMITDSMYNQASTYISSNENFKDKSQYYGITTKAINVEILESSSDSAKVLCSLQQIENKNNTENIFYKTAEVSLLSSDGKWFVNSVSWK